MKSFRQVLHHLGLGFLFQNSTVDVENSAEESLVDWITVVGTVTLIEAQICSSRLEGEGIPVRIQKEAASSALPLTVGILGRIDIQVPRTFKEKAEATLADLMESTAVDDDYEAEELEA